MDRSQILIWLLSLCFSVAPFWGASEIENSSDLEGTFEAAYSALDENIQDEIDFKRGVIAAIDASKEVNEALGVSEATVGDRVAIIPMWAVSALAVDHARRGLMNNVRLFTPDHVESTTLGLNKGETKTKVKLKVAEGRLETQQSILKRAKQKLSALQKKVDPSVTSEGQAASTATVSKEGATAAAEKTATVSKEGATAAAEKTATVPKEGATGRAVPTKTLAETRQKGKEKRKQRAGNAASTESPAQAESGKAASSAAAEKAVPDKAVTAAESGKAVPDKAVTAAESGKAVPDKAVTAAESGKAVPDKAVTAAESGKAAPDKAVTTQKNKDIANVKKLIKDTESKTGELKEKIKTLNTKLGEIKAKLDTRTAQKFRRTVRTARGILHLFRWSSWMTLVGVELIVQVAIASDAVVILFDTTEDMDALREQYVTDIEIAISEMAAEISESQ